MKRGRTRSEPTHLPLTPCLPSIFHLPATQQRSNAATCTSYSRQAALAQRRQIHCYRLIGPVELHLMERLPVPAVQALSEYLSLADILGRLRLVSPSVFERLHHNYQWVQQVASPAGPSGGSFCFFFNESFF